MRSPDCGHSITTSSVNTLSSASRSLAFSAATSASSCRAVRGLAHLRPPLVSGHWSVPVRAVACPSSRPVQQARVGRCAAVATRGQASRRQMSAVVPIRKLRARARTTGNRQVQEKIGGGDRSRTGDGGFAVVSRPCAPVVSQTRLCCTVHGSARLSCSVGTTRAAVGPYVSSATRRRPVGNRSPRTSNSARGTTEARQCSRPRYALLPSSWRHTTHRRRHAIPNPAPASEPGLLRPAGSEALTAPNPGSMVLGRRA